MCSRHEQLPRVIGVGAHWATTAMSAMVFFVAEQVAPGQMSGEGANVRSRVERTPP